MNVIEGQKLNKSMDNIIVRKDKGNRGIKGNNSTGIVLDNEIFSKHILAIGSIGSGKTNLMNHIVKFILSDIKENDIVVFFDAKGDYLKEFYRDGDIVIGDEHKFGEKYNVQHWNLFKDIQYSPVEERLESAREITTSIFKQYIDNSQSPNFLMGARDILTSLIISSLRAMDRGASAWDNEKLKNRLNKWTIEDIKKRTNQYEDLKWASSYLMNEGSATTQSYISPLYMVAQEVFVGPFAKSGNFSMREAIREKGGKSIFLEYDITRGNLLKPMYTVLLDLAMKEALGRNDKGGNVYFILDEFPLIPKLSYIDNALNFGRSLGVKVLAGIQNVGQVEHTYTESMATSLMSGFSTMFAFKLFDEKSRHMISQRYGKNRTLTSVISSNSHKGINDSILDTNVIEDWDITTLNVGQCIVSMLNEEPFIFNPVKYEERE